MPNSKLNKNTWTATRPANLALIKYMGKTDFAENYPTNPSLSYTLNNLTSTVSLSLHTGSHDIWDMTCLFSESAKKRFLAHLYYLKTTFHFDGCFKIHSCNSFPANCGLASSASSFAALTDCAIKAIYSCSPSLAKKKPLPSLEYLSELSRFGSGSSARSFFSPWAIWKDKQAKAIDLPYHHLHHYVIIVSKKPKSIPSSQAHKQVLSSYLFQHRPQRAILRLEKLLEALKSKAWKEAYLLIWQEFHDMHALFETAYPPFGYMIADTLKVLTQIREYWNQHEDGPLVTLDAGANIHLLVRPDYLATFAPWIQSMQQNYEIMK